MLTPKIKHIIKDTLSIENHQVTIQDPEKLKRDTIDKLVLQAVFGSEQDKQLSRWLIWEAAQKLNIKPASINDLYIARGREEAPLNFTVPAINLRGITYDLARSIFKAANKLNVGTLICEIARSEIDYTDQHPQEYTTVVLAAAIKENWQGGIPLQGDHFQAKAQQPGKPKQGEIQAIKDLAQQAINAGFYNIDIDMSTLVDLDKPTEKKQQQGNIKYSIELAEFIRSIEPDNITISLGGEIGHIGGKNSTLEDFQAYIQGFNQKLGSELTGISKISVATGTHHGGVVLEDGSLANVPVDFQVLKNISQACRKHNISGAVQHGASTLPDQYFAQFPKAQAIEVHLATGFQNIIMDHPAFPQDLLEQIYNWLDQNKQDERKKDQTDEQFHYKLRKKAWGHFKKQTWLIPKKNKSQIRQSLTDRFEFMFKQLNVVNTKSLAEKWIQPPQIHKTPQDFSPPQKTKSVKGLAD